MKETCVENLVAMKARGTHEWVVKSKKAPFLKLLSLRWQQNGTALVRSASNPRFNQTLPKIDVGFYYCCRLFVSLIVKPVPAVLIAHCLT